MIVGIDEVGRGPWAGPLVFGAVVLGGAVIEELTDSKKLTKKKREQLDMVIRAEAVAYGLGWVSADELDEVGMSKACTLACQRALEQINVPYTEIIIDGTVNFLKETGKGPYVTTMKQADLLVPSVSAASVLAKVARDKFMVEQDKVFPDYGFASHVGYGTASHRVALEKHGVTTLHRKSFSPIANILGIEKTILAKKQLATTTRSIGNKSEDAVAKYLEHHGYRIVERNWKNRVCEIDIVASKNDVLYFVEVKHRTNDRQGGGLAAITATKISQMRFASRVYAHFIKQDNADMRLAVAITQGADMSVVDFMENIE